MNPDNQNTPELKDTWYTAQNLRKTGWKIISEVSLIPSAFRAMKAMKNGAQALWHVRPDFMRSADEFAKKGHAYEITDFSKFADASYMDKAGHAAQAHKDSSVLNYGFKRHSHPAFTVNGNPDKVIETSWKGKKPLAEIGLKYVGPVQK